jgi:hypothetical protein
MGLKGRNRRAEERNSCKIEVEYSVECRDSEKLALDRRRTYTADISHIGAGIYANCCVKQGQEIKISLFNLRKDPIIGEVRWCEKHADDLYKIGVQFCESLIRPYPSFNLLDFNFS